MYRLLATTSILCSLTFTAFASDIPAFLKDRVYSTNPEKCGDVTEDDSLQLSKEGVFGYEFGCKFLGFDKDVDSDTGKTYLVVARANCGDDSGINRPDLITLIPQNENETITVQSQTEFIASEAAYLMASRLPERIKLRDPLPDFVSREYKICK